MKPIITMIMVMSLDGIILREEGEDVTKWTSKEDQIHFRNILNNFDAIITGRKSYFGKVINKPYFILTNSLAKDDEKNNLFYTGGDPVKIIKAITEKGYNNIALLGGTETNMQFLKAGLVDQLIITIEPFLFGAFKHITLEEKLNIKLKLVNYHQMNDQGTLVLQYLVYNRSKTIPYRNYLDIMPTSAKDKDNDLLSEENKKFWNERAVLHEKTEFYKTSNLINNLSLMDYELNEMGNIKGKKIIHLQCHIATESISLAKLGAEVTAVDYSETAIEVAKKLAKQNNVNINFICCDIYDIIKHVKQKKYDIVYVNFGALIFLKDLDRWGKIVSSLLKPNGYLYLNELHPISAVLSDYEPKFVRDYFDKTPQIWNENGSYADGIDKRGEKKTKNNDLTVWNWGLGDIITTISRNNLFIEFLHEHEKHIDKRFYYLKKNKDNLWVVPKHMPNFPATFSLKAKKIKVGS